LKYHLGRTYGFRLLLEPRVQLAAVVVTLAVVLLFRALQFAAFTTQDQWGYDFSAYWLAGRHLLDGLPIYTAQQLAGPYPPQQQYLYLYPPFLAVIAAPLAAVFDDYRHAAWIWSAVGALVAIAAVVGVARAEGMRQRRQLFLLVAATFALPAVIAELVLGNVHVLLLGLLGLAWLGVRIGAPRGEVLAGAAVGVAALIKIFPAALVLWFVLTGRWRAALAAGATVAILAMVTLPFTGLQAWLDYPIVLANLGPPPGKADALAPTVWLTEVTSFTVARVLVTAGGLAILIWSSRRQATAISFGVAVMVSLLVAPALYHTYLSLTVLPFLLAMSHLGVGPALAFSYLAMFGGEQPALGDLAWIVSRGLPTLGALGVLSVLLTARSDQAAERATPERAATTSAPSS